ncbi:MAG: hypothetical protein JWO82_1362 [Akkermansiaceae bacterium]|nr:hypothetical protein [Akkermansiaceae bacterium]
MSISELIEQLSKVGTLEKRSPLPESLPYPELLGRNLEGVLPEELAFEISGEDGPAAVREFRRHFSGGRIFEWMIRETDDWFRFELNVNRVLVGHPDEGGDPYLNGVFIIASRLTGASSHIGIDLHPERFGWIGQYWYQGNLNEGGYPVIAKSFAEWLEQVLEAGNQYKDPYWYMPDFPALGSALPWDDDYRENRLRL